MAKPSFIWKCLLPAALAASAAIARESPPPPGPALAFADIADLTLAAPVAARVRIARATALGAKQAAGVKPGLVRFYVEGDLVALIRAPQSLPARLAWVVDLPRDAKGKPPKLRKGSEVILLAAPVPARPAELRLVAPDAQLPFTAETAETVRTIVREATGASPPPRIVGISGAFHVPGTVAGESETQIFLQTANASPVSLNVVRRPGQSPQWAVALSEIVDEAAAPPARDTLLWYRLACFLPRSVPAQSIGDAGSASAIQADYRLVLERLGPCTRVRAR